MPSEGPALFELTSVNPSKIYFPDVPETPSEEFTIYPAQKWRFAKISNVSNVLYEAINTNDTDSRWWLRRTDTGHFTIRMAGATYDTETSASIKETLRHTIESIGSFVENISSVSSSAYPSNGTQGNYWYEYKGSDTIDPTTVSYSTRDLYPNEPVTITVTPRTPIYGGTVYYQYQYSVNGTTWTNIGNKTTATSKTITIPEGAERFQARVQASDGWGFTSTTYVTGGNLPVSQIKAYATVSEKLRAGAKLYATVGGKTRQIQKGYATVGGKIRKLF